MSDVLVLVLVLLLLGSGYLAGRVHAELGYRAGFRLGYRQGHADGARVRPAAPIDEPTATVQVTGTDASEASDSRQYDRMVRAGVQ